MMLAEQYHIVPVLSDQDLTAAALMKGDSINMKNFHSACFIVNCQTLGGADTTINVYSGATDTAVSSALTFNYAWASAAAAAANCDVLGAWTSATSVTVANATKSNYMLIIEVDAAAMDIANAEEWLTLTITDPGGATGNMSVHAILRPRYARNVHPTALT